MNLKLGSLFDGSGGFPLAGLLCGVEPVWAAEVEPYPVAVTCSRFPNMKHYGDVSKVCGANVEPVDIVTFGSPCQDLSVAGKRAGLKHEENGDDETTRSGLFMEAVRIIKEMREATNGEHPTFAVWENVPGAFSSNKGEDFRTVLEEIIKITEPTAVVPPVPKGGWAYADCYVGDGWSVAYRVLDAQYWGVPQRRKRIYLVADFRGQRAKEVLFERKGLRGYFAEGRTAWQGTAGDAENCAGATDREGYDRNSLVYAIDQQGGKGGANYAENVMPTLCSDSHGTPHAVAYPYTLKIRSGCEGGGKGALVQVDKSATLATNNDQYLFQPVKQYLFENHSQDTRYRDPLDVCPMLPAQLGTGGNNTPFVVEGTAIPIHDQATRFFGKRGDKRDGKGNGLGVGEPGDPMNTLTGGDRHAVAYTMQAFGYYKDCGVASGLKARDYKDATDLVCQYVDTTHADDVARLDEVTALLQARDYKGGKLVAIEEPNAVCVRYIVRRLTPTECARLQGFPDFWGYPDKKDDFDDGEYKFWLDVRNTHAIINGKSEKEYTKSQMLTWYNKLHTDSSEYKMWGNGIALPCALYVLQGIAEAF